MKAFVIAVFVLGVIAITGYGLVLLTADVRAHNRNWSEKCGKAGGVILATRDKDYCIKSEALIKL